MSALFRVSIGAIAIGLCTLPLGSAVAQQSAGTRGGSDFKPGQARSEAANPVGEANQSTQTIRPRDNGRSAGAPQTDRVQPDRATTARQHSANYRGPQPGAAGQSQEVEQFFANCLLKQNQGEVELSELALQHAQNPEVKQFAQQMIKDHRQMIQQLQQVAGTQAGATPATSSTSASSSERSSTDASSSSSEKSNKAAPANDLPGSSTATATTSQSGTAGETAATQAADSTRSLTAAAGSNDAVGQIGQIEQQIAERCMQMAKEELQQKQGADFDKCYIGSAVGAHMHVLAALEVLSQSSQGELAKIAQSAQPTVQQHLDHAKDLMKQIEGESGRKTASSRSSSNDTSQAERTSTDSTQRQ